MNQEHSPSGQSGSDEHGAADAQETSHAPLFREALFSKYFARTLFILLPILGFWIGVEWEKGWEAGSKTLPTPNTPTSIASPSQPGTPSFSYDVPTWLKEVCTDGDACCIASAYEASDSGAHIVNDGEDCEEGMVRASLSCANSLKWCEQVNVYEDDIKVMTALVESLDDPCGYIRAGGLPHTPSELEDDLRSGKHIRFGDESTYCSYTLSQIYAQMLEPGPGASKDAVAAFLIMYLGYADALTVLQNEGLFE